MRTLLIIVATPLLDDDLCLAERAEDLAVEQLIPEPGVEAFDISVFPRASWRDVGGSCAYRPDPLLYGVSDEFGTVV